VYNQISQFLTSDTYLALLDSQYLVSIHNLNNVRIAVEPLYDNTIAHISEPYDPFWLNLAMEEDLMDILSYGYLFQALSFSYDISMIKNGERDANIPFVKKESRFTQVFGLDPSAPLPNASLHDMFQTLDHDFEDNSILILSKRKHKTYSHLLERHLRPVIQASSSSKSNEANKHSGKAALTIEKGSD
jgi:hypothetical protein